MATSEAWNHGVRGKEEVTAFRSSTAETGGRKPTSIRWEVEEGLPAVPARHVEGWQEPKCGDL